MGEVEARPLEPSSSRKEAALAGLTGDVLISEASSCLSRSSRRVATSTRAALRFRTFLCSKETAVPLSQRSFTDETAVLPRASMSRLLPPPAQLSSSLAGAGGAGGRRGRAGVYAMAAAVASWGMRYSAWACRSAATAAPLASEPSPTFSVNRVRTRAWKARARASTSTSTGGAILGCVASSCTDAAAMAVAG